MNLVLNIELSVIVPYLKNSASSFGPLISGSYIDWNFSFASSLLNIENSAKANINTWNVIHRHLNINWGFKGVLYHRSSDLFVSLQYCFVVVVSSFQLLNSLQWNRVPCILPMRTKSQGNEVILSTYYHSNLIRTTPLLIEFF